jgi:serine/threonine protein kinase
MSGGLVSVDSDLYSLGALLYRFFSGRDPFEDSDLESLKAKYIWAAPRSLASVSHVSKTIGDVVADLLHKDPGLRKAAFDALKDELGIVRMAASRAPALGLHDSVAQTLRRLMDKPGLSMEVVEGPAGAGKSRFIEELQNRTSLEGIVSVVCPSTQDLYADFVKGCVVAEGNALETEAVLCPASRLRCGDTIINRQANSRI